MVAHSTKKKTESSSAKMSNLWLYALFVVVVSFFTYFYNYSFPPDPFWDEPYHIASAEKYLNGVFFMEQHPPLGKLLIAAGEHLLDVNENDHQFINTDYARGIPEDFSFAGYRFFPTVLGWLTGLLLFFIFVLFTRSPPAAALLSFLYIFDNAQIVHSRGAMVDSPLTFFGFATLLLILLLVKVDTKHIWKFFFLSLLAGASFGAVMTTKLVGLIFVLAFFWALYEFRNDREKIPVFIFGSLLGFVIVFVGVWHTHFALGKSLQPELSNNGYYESSSQAKKIINLGKTDKLSSFPVLLRDSMMYVPFYSKGVPKLDLCKEGENGSPSFFWPIGAKTINYRWTADGDAFRYLYLVSNPVAWALGFIGVLLSTAIILSSWFMNSKVKLSYKSEMLLLLALYWGYMIAISQLDRVMYLYHYFVPLNISFLLFGLLMLSIDRVGSFVLTSSRKIIVVTLLAFMVFLSFQYYRAFSYYGPITNESLKNRAILPLWELHCAHCPRESSILKPPTN